MSKNFLNEIPVRGYINALVLQHLENDSQVAGKIERLLPDIGAFPQGHKHVLRDPSFVLGLLYALIVVPKELWLASEDNPLYEALKNENICTCFPSLFLIIDSKEIKHIISSIILEIQFLMQTSK